MVFKGGTSLTKCYQILDHLSEDIDISYAASEDVPGESRKRQLKRWLLELKPELVIETYIPLVFILENLIIFFQSRNDTGSQEAADAKNIRESFLLFCCLKAGRHIGTEQHSQERKGEGDCRM